MAPLATLAFCALLAAAAASDLARFRIPNLLTAALAVAALVLAFPASGGEALARAASFAVVGAAALGLYGARALGGGDVKLLAATALWIPLSGLPLFLEALAFAGGVQALFTLGARRLAGPGLAVRRVRMPYGLSIAAAGFAWAALRGLS
jgi:prepilin peptidase CpaA